MAMKNFELELELELELVVLKCLWSLLTLLYASDDSGHSENPRRGGLDEVTYSNHRAHTQIYTALDRFRWMSSPLITNQSWGEEASSRIYKQLHLWTMRT